MGSRSFVLSTYRVRRWIAASRCFLQRRPERNYKTLIAKSPSLYIRHFFF